MIILTFYDIKKKLVNSLYPELKFFQKCLIRSRDVQFLSDECLRLFSIRQICLVNIQKVKELFTNIKSAKYKYKITNRL